MHIQDWRYYRKMITARTAIRTIVRICAILQGNNDPYLWGYEKGAAGEFDLCVESMVEEVRRLRQDAMEYRELKKALQKVVS